MTASHSGTCYRLLMTEASKSTRILTRMMESIRAPKLDPMASKELLRPKTVTRTFDAPGKDDEDDAEGKK